MSRAKEPDRLRPRPPRTWLAELGRRYPGVDPRASVPLLRLLNLTSDIREDFARSFATEGLTEARFSLAMMILRMEWESGAASPSELAAQSGIGRAAMTQLLDGLEESGWIDRRPHPKDRRRIAIELTRHAHERLDAFLPNHYRRVERLFAAVSATERKRLVKLLDAIAAGLSDA